MFREGRTFPSTIENPLSKQSMTSSLIIRTLLEPVHPLNKNMASELFLEVPGLEKPHNFLRLPNELKRYRIRWLFSSILAKILFLLSETNKQAQKYFWAEQLQQRFFNRKIYFRSIANSCLS